ncbi:MAG: hypothetical protein JSV59_06290 [Flavobacteriaceae bacterium]|nr:MAG: hypothetical protein JSV59_06290 [Flavobacteriaceae bacterium]
MKDYTVNIKIKLAALWTSVTFLYIYGDYFELYAPGKVDSLISGENNLSSPTLLLIASIILAIPSLMIFLSLILKPNLNKWLNIVFGLLFTLMMLLIAVTSITPWYSFYVFYAILESILTATIVWYAFKWPKENN